MNKFLFVFLVVAQSVSFGADVDQVLKKADEVFSELNQKAYQLDEEALDGVRRGLGYISRELKFYPGVSPFKFQLKNDTLSVFGADGKLIVNWNHHDKMEVVGNYVALLDSGKEFAAYTSAGVELVSKWRDVKEYYLHSGYIGLLDNKGIFDAYLTQVTAKKAIISNWKDTIQVVAKRRYIALLDSAGIFQGYDLNGTEIIRVEGVQSIRAVDGRTIEYTLRNGKVQTFPLVQ